MLSIFSCKICNLEKYPYSSSDFGLLLNSCITLTSILHVEVHIHIYYCTTIFIQSLAEMIVQSSLAVKLFSFPILFLTLIELSTEKSRNDQAEEGCTCEHLSCQILVFPLMLVFYISPKFRTWNSKGCHCELN